jgi:anti-sigma factor RsiW
MRTLAAHLRSCHSCSADALARVQMKRTIQVAGKHFTPSAEFRRRVRHSIAPKPQRSLGLGWMLVSAAVILVVGTLTSGYLGTRSGRDQVFSEIADLHGATLASSSPVDVISTDRHTVKPWFQGKFLSRLTYRNSRTQTSLSLAAGLPISSKRRAHISFTMCGSTIFPCSYSTSAHCRLSWAKSLILRRNCRSTWKHGVKVGFAIS